MKIIVSAGTGLKREINGPYAVCGSRHDIELLHKALGRELERDLPFSYGWIEITELPGVHANEQPIPWELP